MNYEIHRVDDHVIELIDGPLKSEILYLNGKVIEKNDEVDIMNRFRGISNER